jgi:hypothetical protein
LNLTAGGSNLIFSAPFGLEEKMSLTHARAIYGVFFLLLLMQVGCGGGASASKMEAPDLGLSVRVPDGWKVDRHNPRLCSRGDSTGVVLDEPLGNQSFADRADQLLRENNGKVLSKSSTTVGGFEAIQAVIEYPNAGSTALKAYIHKRDKLIEVSFVTPTPEFARQEAALRAALQSIELK